jgi:hypothetical protein
VILVMIAVLCAIVIVGLVNSYQQSSR